MWERCSGVAVGIAMALLTYGAVVRPIQQSRLIRPEEREIFILTATLLWGIMVQELIAYLFTDSAKTVLPIVAGVMPILGVRTPANELFTAVICWAAIGILWLLVNRTRTGKAVMAASMNARGVTLLGIELSWIYLVVWTIYGALVGIAGVLLGMFLGVSSYSAGPLTGSAFAIVVLGGVGQCVGVADRGVCGGVYRDHHGVFRPDLRDQSRVDVVSVHPGAAAAGRGHVCQAARPAREALMRWILTGALVVLLAVLGVLPLGASGYILGVLTVAYYFSVFAMAWDLLFGFANEVNFGPTFLIGLGAYGAGILDGHGYPIWFDVIAGTLIAVAGGIVLALPALRLTGPYFGLTTLVAVLILQNLVVVFAGFTGGEIGLMVPDVISIDAGTNYWIAYVFMVICGGDPLRAIAVADRAHSSS